MFNRLIKFESPLITIEDLRITFNVIKTLNGLPSSAEITIYNLDSEYRTLFEIIDGLEIQLSAGYEDSGIFLLFDGEVTNVINMYQKPDWMTKFYAYNSKRVMNDSVTNKSLPPNLDAEQMVGELINRMEGVSEGVKTGVQSLFNKDESLLHKTLRGQSWSENLKTLWDRISKTFDFDYAIDNKVVDVVPKNQPATDEPPIPINQTSIPQMIGAPERTEIGVNVKSYLYPQARVLRRFQIESSAVTTNIGNLLFVVRPPIQNEGIYRIDRLVHTGDTHSNTWQTHFFGRNF